MAGSAGAEACRFRNAATVKQRTPAKGTDADVEPRAGEEERAEDEHELGGDGHRLADEWRPSEGELAGRRGSGARETAGSQMSGSLVRRAGWEEGYDKWGQGKLVTMSR